MMVSILLSKKHKRNIQISRIITWNTNKSDGQPKKIIDNTKLEMVLTWELSTSLTKGLDKAITLYLK